MRLFICRRPIKMSPLCQLEMTLPEGFAGVVWGDGSTDERWGADAARSAAGFASETMASEASLRRSRLKGRFALSGSPLLASLARTPLCP